MGGDAVTVPRVSLTIKISTFYLPDQVSSYLPKLDLRHQATRPVAAFQRPDLSETEMLTRFVVRLVVAW